MFASFDAPARSMVVPSVMIKPTPPSARRDGSRPRRLRRGPVGAFRAGHRCHNDAIGQRKGFVLERTKQRAIDRALDYFRRDRGSDVTHQVCRIVKYRER